MRLLLHTHIALWAVTGSKRLKRRATRLILDADEIFVSVGSLWEIAIKHALGRGDMPVAPDQASAAFSAAGYRFLDIRPQHALAASGLEPIHSDPFDRLLVAQALTEPLTLITADLLVASYSTNFIKVA